MPCRMLSSTAVLIALLLAGCGKSTVEPARNSTKTVRLPESNPIAMPKTLAMFTERTTGSNVSFTYRNDQEAEHYSILESLGGGVALLDYDGDGDLDLFAPGGGEFGADKEIRGVLPGLFRNEGRFRFTEVTREAGFSSAPFYSHGAAAADYDEDGFPDLLITGYGGLQLYRNRGDSTFEQVAVPAGLNNESWSSSAAWGDVDGDGDLDLYLAHYVQWSFDDDVYCPASKPGLREICPPKTYEPLPDVYYSNNSDGTFSDDSDGIGLRDDGKGLGVLIGDFDNDGDVDIYVANDTTANFLYRNDGAGHLEDFSMLSATALSDKGVAEGSMGVELADFNLDGRPDLWVANYERESIGLYRNEGNCSFQYVSQSAGITAVDSLYVGWGTAFLDFDRDGDQDVVVSNGHVVRYPENAPLRQKPLLFENQAGTRFVNVAPAVGKYFTEPHMGRGVARGDIDEDGDVDLVISHINEPVSLLSNDSTDKNNWLSLRLIGTKSNRSAIGSRITLRTAAGAQIRQINGGTSYASTNDPRVYFGLAKADSVESIEISWPAGAVESLFNVSANQVITLIEGQGLQHGHSAL
ncbi:MAG: CRTAC1 family protein [Fuerstiella sp.]